jgi:hypothetical protein
MILTTMFAIGCSGASPTPAEAPKPPADAPNRPADAPDPPPTMSKNDEVLVTVYLHELDAAKLDASTNVCLVVRGEVTDFAAVLAAVRRRYPKAVPDAECSGGGPSGPVVLNAGGDAVRLDIGPITWTDDSTAKITGGGPHSGGMQVNEREYTVVKDGDAWKVTGEKPGLTI